MITSMARRHCSAVLLACALVGAPGCASYHLPDPALADSPNPTKALQVGSVVRVTLKSGEVLGGRVARLDEEAILLGGRGNYGFEEVVIARADIARIELRSQHDHTLNSQMMAAVLLGLLAGVLYGLSQIGNSLN